MPANAKSFAEMVLHELREAEPLASVLEARGRGKTAVIGLLDAGEWVPLVRLSNPSGSFNVMSLDARHRGKWSPTHVRGVPVAIVGALQGPLRFLWEMPAIGAEPWSGTSDQEH